jgi:hypothetical protein
VSPIQTTSTASKLTSSVPTKSSAEAFDQKYLVGAIDVKNLSPPSPDANSNPKEYREWIFNKLRHAIELAAIARKKAYNDNKFDVNLDNNLTQEELRSLELDKIDPNRFIKGYQSNSELTSLQTKNFANDLILFLLSDLNRRRNVLESYGKDNPKVIALGDAWGQISAISKDITDASKNVK